jgi:predicted Zn-dependent protease with MMP-like domain
MTAPSIGKTTPAAAGEPRGHSIPATEKLLKVGRARTPAHRDSTYHDCVVRVSAERFEDLASQVIEGLPEWVKQQMDNVHVTVEDRPPADQPGLLGLYQGVPLTMRGGQYTGLPDTITLYRSTIERAAATEADLVAALRHVIVHEVAHLMGISDQRLRDMDRY